MLSIEKSVANGKAEFRLEGRIDTVSYLDLEEQLEDVLPGLNELTFDFEGVEYVSSAGLRVLLACQKEMNRQGRMVLHNVQPPVMEVFQVTKFINVLTIE